MVSPQLTPQTMFVPGAVKGSSSSPRPQCRDSPVATRLQRGPHHASGSAMGMGQPGPTGGAGKAAQAQGAVTLWRQRQ